MQHWSLAEYHLWKRELVVEALAQAGVVAPVAPISIDAHGQGRRRATLHARRGAKDILEVGFTAPRAHHIVAIDRCPILAPGLDGAIPAAWAIAEILKPTNKPLDIQVTATDSGMDVDVRGSGPLTSGRTTALAGVAEKHKLARVTRHGELVAQAAQPLLKIGRAHVPLPPGAFLQATAEGEATLARLVLDHAGDAKHVADLFCGIGTFALRLAERARVTAADSDAAAVKALATGRGQNQRPQAGGGAGARPVPPPVHGRRAQRDTTPWYSIRRARAPRRRRANWPKAPCRSWSRCHAMRRPSRATRVFWSMAATNSPASRRSISSAIRSTSRWSASSRSSNSKASREIPGWPHIFAIGALLSAHQPCMCRARIERSTVIASKAVTMSSTATMMNTDVQLPVVCLI